MKSLSILACVFALILNFTTASVAGDFDWVKDFNIKVEADPSGFKAQLSTRFNIGGAEVNAVLSNVDNSADAYIALRLGEISGQPTEDVIRKYKSGKGQGWGALAKSLGIKPGAQEFKALKNGDDLYDKSDKGGGNGKDKKKKKK